MPLESGKSKKAFQHNIKAEAHAGKPIKQAVAIAYAKKREAMHKAHGGEIMDEGKKRKARFHEVMAEHYAHGGSVPGDEAFFGHEDFLSQDGEDMPPAGDMMNDEMGDMHEEHMEHEAVEHDLAAERKKRLKSVRFG